MLAAGAWTKSNFVALEEYADSKGWGGEKGPGRVDLLISGPRLDCTLEAKQRWTHAELTDKALDAKIRDGFEAATKDAKRTYRARSKFACVFFSVMFHKRRFASFTKTPDR